MCGSSTSNGWKCIYCTLVNDWDDAQCKACTVETVETVGRFQRFQWVHLPGRAGAVGPARSVHGTSLHTRPPPCVSGLGGLHDGRGNAGWFRTDTMPYLTTPDRTLPRSPSDLIGSRILVVARQWGGCRGPPPVGNGDLYRPLTKIRGTTLENFAGKLEKCPLF
eukprot:gene17380-biopygen18875